MGEELDSFGPPFRIWGSEFRINWLEWPPHLPLAHRGPLHPSCSTKSSSPSPRTASSSGEERLLRDGHSLCPIDYLLL
ncbi:hypothetical protein K1719_024294 [Acacia pycnantha]|nr:hypothetical protein K1719_024294 [Acacia pycnantha]